MGLNDTSDSLVEDCLDECIDFLSELLRLYGLRLSFHINFGQFYGLLLSLLLFLFFDSFYLVAEINVFRFFFPLKCNVLLFIGSDIVSSLLI